MLQGCVEHEVCSRDMTEENTCFFWLVYTNLIVWEPPHCMDSCVRKPQVDNTVIHSRKLQVCTQQGVLLKHI